MEEILFATGNQAKLSQFTAVIGLMGAPFSVSSARARYGDVARYEETGATPEEIAENGACAVANRIGEPVLTEDTALYVDGLDGRPGIFAGRYLKENGLAGLLAECERLKNRKASIVSAATYCSPGAAPRVWVTRIAGEIALESQWRDGLPDWIAPTPENPHGGGYNSIFIPAGSTVPLALLPFDDAIAHGYREPSFRAVISALLEGMT